MTTRMGRWAPLVVVPAMTLALAGCSGDDEGGDSDGESSAAASASPTPTETTTSATISPELRRPPTLRNPSGGVGDIDWDPTSCKTEKGTQTVEGTLTNPSRGPLDYVVTISWTNATSDTLGLGFATVRDVPSRATRPWRLRAEVPDNVTQCVINVLRGQLAGRG